MFKFIECFPLSKIKREKNSRTRVVGSYSNEQLLFSVNTAQATEIYLVNKEGESTLVMSYRKFVDVVFAELSENQEMLFFVERFSKGSGFGFKAFLWHIHSLSQANVFEGNSPITGFFLPLDCENIYQLIYIIGTKISHIKIEIRGKKIKISTVRGKNSIQNNDVSKWFFTKHPLSLLITYKKNLTFYEFNNNCETKSSTYQYDENQDSILPPELALMPSIPRNLPVFKFSRGNMFSIQLGNDIGIVEQLYLGYNSTLTFGVSTVINKYYEIITLHGVPPDVPINYLSDGKIIFLFVVRSFAAFVDFTTSPPITFIAPPKFARGPLTDLSTNIGTNQILVDLNTSKVFEFSFSMQTIGDDIDFHDPSILSVIAVLCARLPYDINIPAVIDKISKLNDTSVSLDFFECFFAAALAVRANSKSKRPNIFKRDNIKSVKIPKEYTEAVEEMEKDFPSAGTISRSQQFRKLIHVLLHGKNDPNECPKLALKILRKHNEASLLLRSAIDTWIDKYRPSEERKFLIYLSVIEESKLASAPTIPCIGDELGIVTTDIATHTMFSHLKSNECFGPLTGTSKKKTEEIKFWSHRFPREQIHQRDHLSSISFPRSASNHSLSTQNLVSMDSMMASDESSSEVN